MPLSCWNEASREHREPRAEAASGFVVPCSPDQIMEKIAGRLGPGYVYNREWFEQTEHRANLARVSSLARHCLLSKRNCPLSVSERLVLISRTFLLARSAAENREAGPGARTGKDEPCEGAGAALKGGRGPMSASSGCSIASAAVARVRVLCAEPRRAPAALSCCRRRRSASATTTSATRTLVRASSANLKPLSPLPWPSQAQQHRSARSLTHTTPAPPSAARGDLGNAFKCYVRTRDYCQTGKHVIDMCLNIIRTSIALGNYVHVANYVQKAEASPDLGTDPAVVAKLRVAAGLSLLDGRKFKLAARKFCETPFELGTDFSDVIAPQARDGG